MNVLITGGGGFIGSNLTKALLNNDQVAQVRILDNFSTGNKYNLEEFRNHPRFQLFEGDIRNPEDCLKACEGIHAITHQAALGSVPRSIQDPVNSHQVNVNGFINVLEAARANHIRRVVYASSSSVYGDLQDSPKIETRVGKVLSPYAATKMTNELYAEAYARNYGITLCGLRYFNVFGPNQDPEGPYAAVIPLFIKAALSGSRPVINGDGTITRDFTPVANVVQINERALFGQLESGTHYVFNVACGQTSDLNSIWELIRDIAGSSAAPIHGPNRKGDILFSLANINHAKEVLGYQPLINLRTSMEVTIRDYKTRFFEGK